GFPSEGLCACRATLTIGKRSLDSVAPMRPDIPVLLFEGIGSQTPVMVRFVDAYLRKKDQPGNELGDLEA
ncbi:MAG TPA: hypothetical protein VJX47_09365, partial [Candidatus Sulfotelmatobacter sp.]|nr:hypothetical protein [Candidatus Sulfotelmatobacter sp.]